MSGRSLIPTACALVGLVVAAASLGAGLAQAPSGGRYKDAAVADTHSALRFKVNAKGTGIAAQAKLGAGFACTKSTLEVPHRIDVSNGKFSYKGPVEKRSGSTAGKLKWKGTWTAPDLVSGKVRFDGKRCHSGRKSWTAALPAARPKGLSALGATSTEVDLTWSEAAHATGYEVLRAAQSGGPFGWSARPWARASPTPGSPRTRASSTSCGR